MKNISALFLCLSIISSYAQKENKYIKADDVSRIIKTLSADDMMGRPASNPIKIEKATAFIENEFKNIGLQSMNGLSGYRQSFTKELISAGKIELTINGELIDSKRILVVSENGTINTNSGLAIQRIDFDATDTNMEQSFYRRAIRITRDKVNTLVIVAEEYQQAYERFKGNFKDRFATGRKGTKVFALCNYKPETYTVKAQQIKKNVVMNNVVGMLLGKTKSDEFVVISGHYDHIGIQQAVEGDSIANGADDDASGTTAVIELARYFKKLKNNNRTLIFVAFTAEEIGGFGSRYFSEQINPVKVVAMFNIEMIGKPSKFGKNSAWITGYEKSDFGEILQKNLTGTPFNFKADPYPEQNLFYRSDNATLARLGVPAHSISTDQIDIDKLYHSVNDEFDSMDIENIVSTIRAIALSSKSIVSGEDTPKRIDNSVVR